MTTSGLRDAALAFHDNGYCVVPARADGSKSPGLQTWRQHQKARPSRQQVETWTGNGIFDGFGVVCGAVSGQLEMLELEGRAVDAGMLEEITGLANNSGLAELWNRVTDGYIEATPSGGIHILYRVDGPAAPNTKLARDMNGNVLAETRGEGGFVVVAPSAGRTHPTGKSWMIQRGGPTSIATITPDEREALYALARALDRTPEPEEPPTTPHTPRQTDGVSPGDDYNQRANWHEILSPRGWTRLHQHGHVTYWRRPGKNIGVSATTGRNGADNLYVFTTSTDFEAEKPYSKFAALALLDHRNDFSATARTLAAQGYGDHQTPRQVNGPQGQAANDPPPPPPDDHQQEAPKLRRIILTPASAIKPKRVRWLWDGRIAYGTLALLAGREGLGKSTLAYDIGARISRGELEGEDQGNPRSVIICASEDSWAHTIVPRLIAAGADLDKIYRVEIETYGDDIRYGISLPKDFAEVSEVAEQTGAGMLILDPLMSVIDAKLDTHRDREVRQALEPLAALADKSRMGVLGLIHHNKSGSSDALQLVMGSKAFSAVARSVHTCIPDPDDENQKRRIFATSKNNLGRLDLPVLGFEIGSFAVETEDDGIAYTGKLNWTGELKGSMQEIMTRSADPDRSTSAEASDWLENFLHQRGGSAAKSDIVRAAKSEGFSDTILRRARERLRLRADRSGQFQAGTVWSLPSAVTEKPVDITEPRRRSDDPTVDASVSGVSSTHATYNTGATQVTVGSTSDTSDTSGPDLHKHAPRTGARAHAGGDDTTDMTDSLTPLHDPHSRHSGQSGHAPPARDTTDLTAPNCPDCGWPLDSLGHSTNCD